MFPPLEVSHAVGSDHDYASCSTVLEDVLAQFDRVVWLQPYCCGVGFSIHFGWNWIVDMCEQHLYDSVSWILNSVKNS